MSATTPSDPLLILASTSRYRRELLSRLGHPFAVQSPEVDETPWPGETPAALTERLAHQKAQAVAVQRPGSIVIGSDQVADLDGQALGKPGTHDRAVAQLQSLSGRSVVFHTAVCVQRPSTGYVGLSRVAVQVRFRTLSDRDIENYLRAERPYDCAGSAKSEGLGIALLEAIESDDPTALIGLPLIATTRLLREAGWDPLDPHPAQARGDAT